MVLEKAEGGNKSTSTTQLNNSTQQKNKTGPGALAPPHAGLGRRGHLERRCRCDARARGAGAGEEGALRCVRAEKRGGRRERRGDLKTPSSPSFLLFFSSSSPLLLSHRRPLYTMSQSLVSFFALPKIEEKTLCEPRKPIFECFLLFSPPTKTHLEKLSFELAAARAIWRFSPSSSSAACFSSHVAAARPGSSGSGDAAPRSKREQRRPDRTNRNRKRCSPRRSPPIPVRRLSFLFQDEGRTR